MKIRRVLRADEIRKMCIDHGLYTYGTNEDYAEMFQMARDARTDDDFVAVAQNIWDHSDTDMLEGEGFEFETLIWIVLNKCVVANIWTGEIEEVIQ